MCLLYNKAVVVARCVYVIRMYYIYYIYMHSARMYNTYIEIRKYKWAWLITFKSISTIFTTNFLDEEIWTFSNFSCMFLNPRNLQEQVKKAFCYQKLFWPFTVWVNCSSDLKSFANSGPTVSNLETFSQSIEHFFSQEVRSILVTKYH